MYYVRCSLHYFFPICKKWTLSVGLDSRLSVGLVGLEYGAKDEGMYSVGFRRLCVLSDLREIA